jgi:type IV pilus assembly protein PilM
MAKTANFKSHMNEGANVRSAFSRWFPTPGIMSVNAAGVDISDSSVKWISLKPAKRGWEVDKHLEIPLEPGIVEGGVVRNEDKLAETIANLKNEINGEDFTHAALPEEAAYVFNMHVQNVHDRSQVLNMIEFELEGRVPLKANQAVYDFDIVSMHYDGIGAEIGVTVFPKEVVKGYLSAFKLSGVTLLSLEIEARSISRAVIPTGEEGVVLIADFGRARTGIAIIKKGIPIFTSTVSVGGDTMTKVITEKLGVDIEEAEKFKNDYGISPDGDKNVSEAMSGTAMALSDEITKHYQYWDTKKNEHGERVTPVEKVILCGGSANLKGLPEYIAGRVHAITKRANVWENVCDFEDYIPPIDRHHSLGYATSIGLALRSAK